MTQKKNFEKNQKSGLRNFCQGALVVYGETHDTIFLGQK